jgi:hypothetical protein
MVLIVRVRKGQSEMLSVHFTRLQQVLKFLACVLVLKVTVSIMLNYREYLPPDFDSPFLQGRERYFGGPYQWAFYAHIASGPCSLVLGMILLSERFRQRYPKWHRMLGRLQIACVLLLVVPGGLWMSFYAETGAVAGIGFAVLAVATGLTVTFGWRFTVKQRFTEHRRWMWRCYLLLCSAVVLRLTAGLATVTGVEGEWLYPMAAWTSWLVPLAAFEVVQWRKLRRMRLKFTAVRPWLILAFCGWLTFCK